MLTSGTVVSDLLSKRKFWLKKKKHLSETAGAFFVVTLGLVPRMTKTVYNGQLIQKPL